MRAQSFQQFASQARFFEYLGYFLVALAIAIVIGWVSWSARKRFTGTSRIVFAVASLAVLALLLLSVAAGLTIAWVWNASVAPVERVRRAPLQRLSPKTTPKTDKLVIHLVDEDSLTIAGVTIAQDDFPAFLDRAVEAWAEQGIQIENVSVEILCDPNVTHGELVELMDRCQQAGIMVMTMKIDE